MYLHLHPVCDYLLNKVSYVQFSGSLCALVLVNIIDADPTYLSYSLTMGRTIGSEWVWYWMANTG